MILLFGCGSPISNQVFLDEASFVGALPSEARLHAPGNVLLAPDGDAEVLRVAKGEAARWDAWWRVAAATGEELRATPATERTEVVRRWDPLNVAARGVLGEPDVLDWWAVAEVVVPAGAAPTWTISIAATEDGPFVEVGSGETDSGVGAIDWDLAGTAEALGITLDPLGTLAASFTDSDPNYGGARSAGADYALDGFEAPFGLVGEEVFVFTAPLAITTDGEAWLAFATVVHTGDGGRAQGVVLEAGVERSFTSCWDGDGQLLYQAGEGSVIPAGTTDAACAIGAF